ncbi:unnamed protein product [Calicophoron daubneyi]|uniref:Uncharacterized protein n=1 Tax=Calicophoron daubneyi TaxID=300641 RepID=A0AAV2U0T8_CALDB
MGSITSVCRRQSRAQQSGTQELGMKYEPMKVAGNSRFQDCSSSLGKMCTSESFEPPCSSVDVSTEMHSLLAEKSVDDGRCSGQRTTFRRGVSMTRGARTFSPQVLDRLSKRVPPEGFPEIYFKPIEADKTHSGNISTDILGESRTASKIQDTQLFGSPFPGHVVLNQGQYAGEKSLDTYLFDPRKDFYHLTYEDNPTEDLEEFYMDGAYSDVEHRVP